MGQRDVLAHKTRSWVKRAIEGIAAPWIAGVEVEVKKKKKIRGRLSPKIMYLPFPSNGARKLVGTL